MQEDDGRTRQELDATAKGGRSSLAAEFLYYLRRYRCWALVPILLALALLGALVALGGSGARPFIYDLF